MPCRFVNAGWPQSKVDRKYYDGHFDGGRVMPPILWNGCAVYMAVSFRIVFVYSANNEVTTFLLHFSNC